MSGRLVFPPLLSLVGLLLTQIHKEIEIAPHFKGVSSEKLLPNSGPSWILSFAKTHFKFSFQDWVQRAIFLPRFVCLLSAYCLSCFSLFPDSI